MNWGDLGWLFLRLPEEQNMSLQMYFKCLTIAGLKWGEKQPWDFSLEMSEGLGHQKRIIMVLSTGSVCLTLCKNRQAAEFTESWEGRKVILRVPVLVCLCVRVHADVRVWGGLLSHFTLKKHGVGAWPCCWDGVSTAQPTKIWPAAAGTQHPLETLVQAGLLLMNRRDYICQRVWWLELKTNMRGWSEAELCSCARTRRVYSVFVLSVGLQRGGTNF